MSRKTMDLAMLAASVSQLSPAQSKLQQLVQEKLSDERLGKVVDGLLAKAEKGCTKSLDYLLAIGGMKPSAPTTVTINNFIDGDEPPIPVANRVVNRSHLDSVCVLLSVSGPTLPETIAGQTGLPLPEVIRILDDNPNRFGVEGRNYFLKGQVS